MSVETVNSTEEEIMRQLKQSPDPFMTAPEIAERIGMTRQSVSYNLRNLKERGRVDRKKAGSNAVGWWATD